MGSFTTKKRRPADVDYILLLQTPKIENEFWSIDLVIASGGKEGTAMLEDARKWMKQKYGLKNSVRTQLKYEEKKFRDGRSVCKNDISRASTHLVPSTLFTLPV